MQRIGFVVVPDFQVMVFAALSVFELANETAPAPYYHVRLLSEHGGPMRCSLGYSVTTDPLDDGHFDTVIVSARTRVVPTPPGDFEFPEKIHGVFTARRCDVRRGILFGGSRPIGRQARHDALGVRAPDEARLSQGESGGGSHFYYRRTGMDIRRHDRRHRHGARDGGKRIWATTWRVWSRRSSWYRTGAPVASCNTRRCSNWMPNRIESRPLWCTRRIISERCSASISLRRPPT